MVVGHQGLVSFKDKTTIFYIQKFHYVSGFTMVRFIFKRVRNQVTLQETKVLFSIQETMEWFLSEGGGW